MSPCHYTYPLPSSTSVDSSKYYEITIFVARIRITVTPIFAHQSIGIWTSVNNYSSCATYPVCRAQVRSRRQKATLSDSRLVNRSNGTRVDYIQVRERSIVEIRDIHTPPDFMWPRNAQPYFVSSIPCIGRNRCHLASDCVIGYVVT